MILQKRKNLIIILALIICVSLFLICSKGSDKITLDEVRLKDKASNKEMFAIMVEQNEGNGDYKENENNIFPGAGYYYNETKSGCVDGNNKEVTDVLIYDRETKKFSVRTKQTVYCYLYFGKDSVLPDVTNFYVGTHHGEEYTNVKDKKKVHIEWNDEDITDYCLTTTNSTDGCSWQPISGIQTVWLDNEIMSIASTHTAETTVDLEEENKKYNYYVYLKDKAGNISTLDDLSQDEITLDTEAPNITGISKEGDNETSIKVNVTVDDPAGTDGNAGSGLAHIYFKIKEKNGSYIGSEVDTGTTKTYTFNSGLKAGTEYTVEVRATDTVGNNSLVNTQDFTTKKQPKDDLYKLCKGYSNIGECMQKEGDNTGDILNFKKSSKGDLDYRYVGKQSEIVDNYVCFGTSSCPQEETDDHMYRIIGITSEGQLKIQKNSSINTSKWNEKLSLSDCSGETCKWPNSTIYTYLKGSDFYTSDTYVSQAMKNKIETGHTWNTGDVQSYSDGTTVYNAEALTHSHTGAVGLAYLSDYYFAYNEGGTQNCNNGSYCQSWMIPTDTKNLWKNTSYEWTMSRYGYHGSDYDAWHVRSAGRAGYNSLNGTDAVRPVFYLQSTATISGGEGTLKSPYIIN